MQRYDFSQNPPASTSSDSLDSLHAFFASTLAATLRDSLAINVEIAPGATESMSYADFIASRAVPACLSLLRIEPLGMQIALDLRPQLAYAVIDRLLGGRGDSPHTPAARGFTQIEQGLALQIIERAASALADTWRSSGVESAREEGLFTDPTQVRIMPGEEIVSVITFHTTFNGITSQMTLCLPAPLTDLLGGANQTAPVSLPTVAQRQRDAQNLTKNVMQSAVELRALLAETKLRLNEVLELTEGDIITTDIPADSVIPLRLADQTVLHARLGHFNGRRAVEIAKPAGGQLPA